MWKSNNKISGFQVIFEPDRDGLERWPQLSHTFGTTQLTSRSEILSLSNEIKDIEFCFENEMFEGFRFTMYNEDEKTVLGITDCDSWTDPVGLERRRLIGFKVETTECLDCNVPHNIVLIQPIVDCPDCSNTQVSLRNLNPLELDVGGGTAALQLITDSISESYFERDGYSNCQGNFQLSLTS